ncbi:MAG TPA: TadE/TadG family type IV pilus assembly protein [Candidatus Limnocylindria bacterium]|nr:TadE/TadG family type IV pilus assembly protein [Candidatus Limnocylindria bacterium]
MRGLRGAARDERAQSLVEFALILPLLLLIVTGLFDVARAVWQENTLAFAAREATRYALVHGSTSTTPIGPCSSCTDATLLGVVQKASVGVPTITIVVDYPDGNNDRNSRVTVDASAPFVPLPSQYLLNGAFSITLRGGSQLVIQR